VKTRISKMITIAAMLFSTSAFAANGPLQVGAAKIDVTPGEPAAPATGKYDHERLYTRAIVLDNGVTRVALVSMEAGRLTPAGLSLLTDELDVPEANIVVSGTHTHSSRVRGVTPGGRSAEPEAPDTATEADRNALKAVQEARAKLQPASVGFGEGFSFLNVNRDAIDPATGKWHQGTNPEGPSDKTVAVLMFKKPSGEPIAAYVNYAMHPVSGYVSGVVSGDYAGAMARYVEKAFKDEMITAFTQGASGDQNPLYLRTSTNVMASRNRSEITGYVMDRESSEALLRPNAGEAGQPADPAVMDDLLRFMESEGQLLGEEVIRVMTLTEDLQDNVAIVAAAEVLSCPGRVRTTGSAWDNATREGVSAEYEDGPDVPIHVGVVRIGNIAVASSTGELYTRIGQRVKKASPLDDTMLVTLTRPYRANGYTPDDLSYGHQTFQVLGARTKQGCAETTIAEGIRSLVVDSLTSD